MDDRSLKDLATKVLKAYNALSPEGKTMADSYARMRGAIPAYVKVITNAGRGSKEQLDIELQNIMPPYFNQSDIGHRIETFQGNLDTQKAGFPKNLAGSHFVEKSKFNKAAESYVNAYVNRALAATPKPSGSSTISYGISPIVGGAAIGAGVGVLKADTDQRTEGALKGAMIGGLAGGALSVPVGLAHWFYTHPAAAVKAFSFASKIVPAASQAAKKYAGTGITHIFIPGVGVTPVEPN